MKKYYIHPYKNDLKLNNKHYKNINLLDTEIKVISNQEYGYIYNTIIFNNLSNKQEIINVLKKQLLFYLNKISLKKHILVVGIGNDNYTADSIGPKVLKHINVNSYLENMGIEINNTKVSALEPGVLGETGIMTEKIICSVVNEIKPDIVILIDSYVSNDINYLNKTIEINNRGLNPGSGIIGIDSVIDDSTLGIPVLVIGVTTAIEIKFTNDKDINYIPYILSTKDVDKFVNTISEIIGISINETIIDL